MSQSRFSIVLVGVSALLRRPFVSRLRPAAFTARGSGGFRRSGRPSVSEITAGRVGLRAHRFRFSACTASGLPLGGLTASAFRFGVAVRRVGLRAHCFRFSARTASEWLLGEFVLPPSDSEIALGGLAFGLTASAFRHAPIRSGRWASSFFHLPLRRLLLVGLAFGLTASAFRHAPLRSDPRRAGSSAGRVGLRAHRFRFSACTASEWPRRVGLRTHGFRFSVRTASGLPSAGWFFHSSGWFFRLPLRKLPSAGWPSGSLLPFFGTRRFGVAAGRVGSSAFRFGDGRRASWPSGSLLPLFGTHRSAPPYRRSEDRRSTTTRQLFHFKTLIPTC